MRVELTCALWLVRETQPRFQSSPLPGGYPNSSLLAAGETDNQRDTTMPDPKPGSPAPDKESKGMAEALRRIEEASRRRFTALDLSGLGLTTLPEAVWQL